MNRKGTVSQVAALALIAAILLGILPATARAQLPGQMSGSEVAKSTLVNLGIYLGIGVGATLIWRHFFRGPRLDEISLAAKPKFPDTAPGEAASSSLTLRNKSKGFVTLTSFSIAGEGFELASPPPQPIVLQPGDTATLLVRATPAAAGASYKGELQIVGMPQGGKKEKPLKVGLEVRGTRG